MSVRPGPPTLQDVARCAGVHPATVSRALSRPEMVATGTRSRVLDAVQTLGFVPNHSAQRLAGGSAHTIGVIVPDIANPFFATLLQAVQMEATQRDLAVLIADSAGDPATEARMLEELSRRVDGLVVATPITNLSSAQVATVQINRQSGNAPSVVIDQSAIVRLAIEHLVQLGHRRIAFVSGPARYWSARRRSRAVQRLKASSSPKTVIEIVHATPATFEGGRGVLDAVRATGATGVVAFNDLQGAGLIVGAHEHGLDVPGDLAIVGSDGLDLAIMTEPTLTTLSADRAQLARLALAKLVDDHGPWQATLQPILRIGASTEIPLRSARNNTRSYHTNVG